MNGAKKKRVKVFLWAPGRINSGTFLPPQPDRDTLISCTPAARGGRTISPGLSPLAWQGQLSEPIRGEGCSLVCGLNCVGLARSSRALDASDFGNWGRDQGDDGASGVPWVFAESEGRDSLSNGYWKAWSEAPRRVGGVKGSATIGAVLGAAWRSTKRMDPRRSGLRLSGRGEREAKQSRRLTLRKPANRP